MLPAARTKEWLSALAAEALHRLPGRGFQRRRLTNSFAEVEVVVADLAEVSTALEEKFLETASALMELEQHGSLFVRQSEKLVNTATGRSGGKEVFFGAMAVLDPPLIFLNDSHLQMKSLLERLKQDNECIVSLINGREDLQRTMAPLKYIQTSFRIESAPLGVEVQTMFNALTQEIEKLHNQVCELFSTKYEELQNIQQTIAEVIGKLEVQTDEVWKNIAREKIQIDSTLKQLQRELSDHQKRESSIVGLSGDLAREIQRVVIGLQFQDIISQRLQHTFKALNEVRAQFDGSDTSIQFLEQACRLEAGQVASVRQELAGAEKSVKGGIQTVLHQISEADAKCVSLKEFEHLTTSADGMVQVLLDVFAALKKQVNATVSGCSSAYEILRPIGSMASDLTKVVNDLSQRIHLIGLNAQVQAAQVTDGMGLEVLSARTSEISRDTNRISESMASQLDHLVAGLTESLRGLEKLHADASGQQGVLAEKGTACEHQLHGLRDAALASLVDVHDLLNGIRSHGEKVLGCAEYVATADASLVRLEATLGSAAAVAKEQIGGRPVVGSEQLAAFQRNYTMASERDVFASVVAAGAAPSVAAKPQRAPTPDVELFDHAPLPEIPPLATAAMPAIATAGNVELF